MWVEKRSKNNFKFVEQYKNPLTGKPKRVSITLSKNTAHTRKEAQAALEAKIRQRLRHIQDDSIKHGVTLAQLKDDWLAEYKDLAKTNTYDNAESRARKIVNDLGGDVLVEKVTPALIEDYLNGLLRKENHKNSTVTKFKGAFGKMFRYAVKHNYVKSNPVQYVKVQYKSDEKTEKTEEKFLDDDELDKVLKFMYAHSPHYGRFCELLYLTGMRFGEAAALYPSDIHRRPDGKTVVTVNSTLVQGKKQMSPKTVNSRRNIVLTNRALLLLRKEQVDHQFKSDFIFESKNGGPLSNGLLNYWLRKAKAEYGIKKKLSSHTFRHTHISKLAELGVPLYLIQNRVGHKDAKTTEAIYLHVTKKAEQELDSKLDLL